jgi:hypothetical protein
VREQLPPVLVEALDRLRGLQEDGVDERTRELAVKAEKHLYRLLETLDTGESPR